MVIIHAWQSLSDTFEARASEWAMSAAILCLGLVCVVNTELFLAPNFHGLTEWLSQQTWAILFLLVGTARLTVLLINGAYWRTPQFRSIFAFISAGVWFQLLLGFAANISFALAIMPFLFLLDAYNALRAAREAGIGLLFHHIKKDAKNAGGDPNVAQH